MLWALFPSLQEGWPRHQENGPVPKRRGRGGAKRKPDRAQPQEKFGAMFRPEDFAELTTPAAALRWLRDFLLMPQPPLLGKEGKVTKLNGFLIRSDALISAVEESP